MMTEQLSTIARPYALAAFEYALDKNDLAGWEGMLSDAALVVKNKTMKGLLQNPDVTSGQIADIFLIILAKELDTEKKNFINLLAEYERFPVLPEIAKLFTELRLQYEKTIPVKIVSATPLDDAYQQKFIDALTRRLKRKVTLECEVNNSLLGGAMIYAGDKVIDGSIKGKLNRLIESI